MTAKPCSVCQRIVYAKDVDGKGRCCFCVEPKPEPMSKIQFPSVWRHDKKGGE